jgi:hypothetical protein
MTLWLNALSLDVALKTVEEERRAGQSIDQQMAELRAGAPGIADMVDDERPRLKPALRICARANAVSRTVTTVQRAHSAEAAQAAPPILSEAAKADLRDLSSPAANNWAAALAALRVVNEQVSVEALIADRFGGFDHVECCRISGPARCRRRVGEGRLSDPYRERNGCDGLHSSAHAIGDRGHRRGHRLAAAVPQHLGASVASPVEFAVEGHEGFPALDAGPFDGAVVLALGGGERCGVALPHGKPTPGLPDAVCEPLRPGKRLCSPPTATAGRISGMARAASHPVTDLEPDPDHRGLAVEYVCPECLHVHRGKDTDWPPPRCRYCQVKMLADDLAIRPARAAHGTG